MNAHHPYHWLLNRVFVAVTLFGWSGNTGTAGRSVCVRLVDPKHDRRPRYPGTPAVGPKTPNRYPPRRLLHLIPASL